MIFYQCVLFSEMIFFFSLVFLLLLNFLFNIPTLIHILLISEFLWISLYFGSLIFGFWYDDVTLLSLSFYCLVFSAIELAIGLIISYFSYTFYRHTLISTPYKPSILSNFFWLKKKTKKSVS